MAFASSLIATLIAIYSLGYIEHTDDEPEYYFIVTLFLGAMMGLVFSDNLIFLYLFWEISALACWRLIGYFREPDYVWKADKAFLVTFGGAVLMLLGFALVYAQFGTFEISALRGTRDRRRRPGPDHGRHLQQERHRAAAHLAARRGRGALHGDLPAARRHPGEDRPLRLRPAVPQRHGHLRAGRDRHPDLRPGERVRLRLRGAAARPTSSACWPTPPSARSATPSWGWPPSPTTATSGRCSTSWPTASPRAGCSSAPGSSSTAPTPRT